MTAPPAPGPVGLAVGATDYRDATRIREVVREALGAGLEVSGSPLVGFVKPGETVLIKPNWVLDRNYSGRGMECMVTHEAILDALIREAREANPARIVIGDAPVQGCRWSELVTPALERRLTRAADGVPISFVDFRRQIMTDEGLSHGHARGGLDDSRYTLFDLGSDSLLEPVSDPPGRFRVTMYDPDRLAENHRVGRHRYLVSREPFEADVVLNVPKLKTHRKAGITAALKNLVGINGNKDYLPHHRVGSPDRGGDCYPGPAPLKRIAEALIDRANRRIGHREYRAWRTLSAVAGNTHAVGSLAVDALRSGRPRTWEEARERRIARLDLEGGWFRNDTVWRMCLDLNRILLYGNEDGTMTEVPRRRVLHVCDAIVCGQAEGPLAPHPLIVGAVTCSTSAAAADRVHCGLLGLDWQRVPIVREAFASFRWPLASHPEAVRVRIAGRDLSPDEGADRFGARAEVPRGWAGHCQRVTSSAGSHP